MTVFVLSTLIFASESWHSKYSGSADVIGFVGAFGGFVALAVCDCDGESCFEFGRWDADEEVGSLFAV